MNSCSTRNYASIKNDKKTFFSMLNLVDTLGKFRFVHIRFFYLKCDFHNNFVKLKKKKGAEAQN